MMVLSSRPLRSSGACLTENHKSLANPSSTSKTSSIRVTRSVKSTKSTNHASPPHKSKRSNHDRSPQRAGRKRRLLEIDENCRSSAQQPYTLANGGQSGETNTTKNRVESLENEVYTRALNVDHVNEKPGLGESPLLKKSQQIHERRTLRSRDERIKPKSDLAIYFPNYEEIIKDIPNDDQSLIAESSIHVIDKLPEAAISSPKLHKSVSTNSTNEPTQLRKTVSLPVRTLAPYNGAQIVDFSSFDRVTHNKTDPLDDDIYFKGHRRAERREKQLRNIEKEKGMHEKLQLDRLLDGLQGPDWLRVLGISGITNSEKREYEPKRDYFIQEVQSLIDKFMAWKDEEKRLRSSNETSFQSRAYAKVGDSGDEASENIENTSIDETASTDLDVWASKQLQDEASSASTVHRPSRRTNNVSQTVPELSKPFTSFYSKAYLRTAALGKHRHGRNATAFGHPIPDCAMHEFSLPEDYLTKDVLRANARKRRRLRREALESRGDTQTRFQ